VVAGRAGTHSRCGMRWVPLTPQAVRWKKTTRN
jgi:hypothetical protein